MKTTNPISRWLQGMRHRREQNNLIASARCQLERLVVDGVPTGTSTSVEPPLYIGEATILSGVKSEVDRITDDYAEQIASLSGKRHRELTEVRRARTVIAELPGREHIVRPTGGGRRRKTPNIEIYGDSVTSQAAETEHDAIDEGIEADAAAGSRRHLHEKSPLWFRLAMGGIFFDVLAMLVVTIGVENASLSAEAWTRDPVLQSQKMATAIAFALIGALAAAFISHLTADRTWSWIHRAANLDLIRKQAKGTSADDNRSEAESAADTGVVAKGADTDRNGSRWPLVVRLPLPLLLGWAALVGIATVIGTMIALRLVRAAHEADLPNIVTIPVAIVFGVAAAAMPLAVALFGAFGASPEVLRRNALAAIISAVRAERESLEKKITDHEMRAAEYLAEAKRVREHAERAIQQAMLPATQMILRLRAEYGHAGEVYTAITLPRRGERSELFDLDAMGRLDTLLTQMIEYTVPHTSVQPRSRTTVSGTAAATWTDTMAPDRGEEQDEAQVLPFHNGPVSQH